MADRISTEGIKRRHNEQSGHSAGGNPDAFSNTRNTFPNNRDVRPPNRNTEIRRPEARPQEKSVPQSRLPQLDQEHINRRQQPVQNHQHQYPNQNWHVSEHTQTEQLQQSERSRSVSAKPVLTKKQVKQLEKLKQGLVPRRNFFRRHKIFTTFLLLIISLYVYGIIITRPALPEGQELTNAQQEKYILEVREKMLLPIDERPKIFVIKDPSTLSREDSFYYGAVEGDIIFVYAVAGKAILWDPVKKLIKNMVPLREGGR